MKIKPTPEQKAKQTLLIRKSKEVEKTKTLRYRIKNNKELTVCWYCWIWTDWITMREKEAVYFNTLPEKRKVMCPNCIKWLSSWVRMICEWHHYITGKPCRMEMVIDLEKIQKYAPTAENWDTFEIQGCSLCSPDKKLHLTKESLNKAIKEYNNNKVVKS